MHWPKCPLDLHHIFVPDGRTLHSDPARTLLRNGQSTSPNLIFWNYNLGELRKKPKDLWLDFLDHDKITSRSLGVKLYFELIRTWLLTFSNMVMFWQKPILAWYKISSVPSISKVLLRSPLSILSSSDFIWFCKQLCDH